MSNMSQAPVAISADSQPGPAESDINDASLPMGRSKTGRITRIFRYATHDGPGIRMLILLKGCPLQCVWCHNPETQKHNRELLHLAVKCTGCGRCRDACSLPKKDKSHPAARPGCRLCGKCVEVCPSGALQFVGEDVSVESIVSVAEKDKVFHRASGGGITVSGGEPLAQPHFTAELLCQCRARGIHTAVETCGFAPAHTLERIAKYVSLWLYDVKHVDSAKHLQYTDKPCTLILQNLSSLLRWDADVIVRIPLIPGFNDSAEDMKHIAARLGEIGIKRVELLPFNPSFATKWQMLGRPVEWQYPSTSQEKNKIDSLRTIISGHVNGNWREAVIRRHKR